MKAKILDKTVKALRPLDKPYELRDTELGGFLLRVQPSGVMVYYVEYRTEDGRRNRYRLGAHPTMTVPKAREKAELKLAGIVMGGDPQAEKKEARKEREALTLREYLSDHYGPWAKTNLKSYAPTMARLNGCFLPVLDRKLIDLTAWDFEKLRQNRLKNKLDTMKRVPKQAGINRDFQTMRAALNRAIQWGHLVINPLDGVKRAREDRNQQIRALTQDEETKVLAVFEGRREKLEAERKERAKKGKSPGPPVPRYLGYLEPLVILSLDTGLRRGEAIALDWKDIDLKAGTVTVQGEGAKSSQTRVVPLSTRVGDTLTEWQAMTADTGPVFPGATIDSLKGQWDRVLTKAEITGLRWHDLRHSFGTRLALAGVPLPTVQRLMGHANITTTARYLHATADDARRGIEALEKANGGNVVAFEKEREARQE